MKHVRLVRRKLRGKSRFYAQLVLEGRPLQKARHQIWEGVIGIGLGPSSVAMVGETGANLERFCDGIEALEKDKRLLQRRLDLSRWATNPENYTEDGAGKAGPKTWKRSNRYLRDKACLEEAERKLTAARKTSHGQMINKTLALGNRFQTE